MKKTILAAVAALATAAPAWAADPIVGLWQSQPGETGGRIHVEMYECGPSICGVIRQVVGNANTSVVGKRMIWDMAPQGGNRYSGGRIWAPDNDKVYRSKMTLQGNALEVEGCVGPFCRGQTWTRLQ